MTEKERFFRDAVQQGGHAREVPTAASEAIRAMTFEVKTDSDGKRSYMPLAAKFEEKDPGLNKDQIIDLYPLLFRCPFFGTARPRVGPPDNAPIPARRRDQVIYEAAALAHVELPTDPGVYFLCDAVDCAAYFHKMTPAAIADFIADIERRFTELDIWKPDLLPNPAGSAPEGGLRLRMDA